jgi:hypothetical protein
MLESLPIAAGYRIALFHGEGILTDIASEDAAWASLLKESTDGAWSRTRFDRPVLGPRARKSAGEHPSPPEQLNLADRTKSGQNHSGESDDSAEWSVSILLLL